MTLMFPKPVFKKKKPKVDIWCDIRRKLEKRFDVVGIDSCEIRLDGCKGRSFLGFVHKVSLTNEGFNHENCLVGRLWS